MQALSDDINCYRRTVGGRQRRRRPRSIQPHNFTARRAQLQRRTLWVYLVKASRNR